MKSKNAKLNFCSSHLKVNISMKLRECSQLFYP